MDLPIDFTHPAVRQYIALIRLQVLTPLSLLINVSTQVVAAFVASPSIGAVSRAHPTSISPSPSVVALYLAAIFVGQLAYSILLVIARKDETKKTVTQGVGLCLVFSNWLMAFWAIAWIFEWFIAATVFQGILLLLLLYANIVLLIYHPPTIKRPLDALFIHAPIRFFLVLQLALMFPLTLFIALGLVLPFKPGKEVDYNYKPWPGFAVVLGTNLLGTAVVILRRDIVWAVAATWICVSLWSHRPKPSSVYITAIVFTVLHPLVLVSTYLWVYLFKRRRIALPPDDDHPGLYQHVENGSRTEPEHNGPREVRTEDVWG